MRFILISAENINNNPLLITGCSGFLGANVLKQLCGRQWQGAVYVAGRKLIELAPFMRYWPLDLCEVSLRLPEGVHTVLHIAGEKSDNTRMDAVNHLGTRRLLEAAIDAKVKRFIYVSSVGAYGALPYSGLIDEAFPHFPRNKYEQSKNDGEIAVRELEKHSGISVVVMQPSNVIGVTDNLSSMPLLGLMRMLKKGWFVWFGKGEPWVNYISIEDVASALIASCQSISKGTYILNTPASLEDFVGWVVDELGCQLPQYRFPLALGSALATLGSGLQIISGRNIPLNKERFLEMTNTNRYNPTRFMKTMDFEYPLGIENSIRSLVREYRQRGLL